MDTRHSVGHVYRVRFNDFECTYILTYCGEDVDGTHLVGLSDPHSGTLWDMPICVDNPDNITDDEFDEIVDPHGNGVEFVLCGPVTAIEFFVPMDAYVQFTRGW